MTTINIGTAPGGEDGDSVRAAMIKIKALIDGLDGETGIVRVDAGVASANDTIPGSSVSGAVASATIATTATNADHATSADAATTATAITVDGDGNTPIPGTTVITGKDTTSDLMQWKLQNGDLVLKADKRGRLCNAIASGTPSIAGGAGAGTGPTCLVGGTDQCGQISVQTGTTPSGDAIVATVTFSHEWDLSPGVLLAPANAAAAALTAGAAVYVSAASTTNFTLSVGSDGLDASTTYLWHYIALGGPANLPATTPVNLTANSGSGTVVLNWDAVDGAVFYKVYRGTVSEGETILNGSVLTNSYTDSTVVTGTRYYYTVTAVNGYGESDQSDEASALAYLLPWLSWSNVKYILDLNNTYLSWKEDVSSVTTTSALTHATTDGDTIGQVDDYSVSAHSTICSSAATRPALTSLTGLKSGALFTFSPTKVLTVQNSQKAFNFIHKTATFFFACRINCTAHDATVMNIAENSSVTTANSGFFFQRSVANKLVFDVVRGSAGNHVATVTSATSVTVGSGTVPVIIEADGVNLKIYINSTTADASAAVGTLGSADAFANLIFGRSQTGTNPFDGTIGDVIIGSGTLTSQQKTDYFNYSPSVRISENPVGWLPNVTMLHSAFDFTGTLYPGTLWKDARGGTGATANGDIVTVAANAVDSTGVLNRDATVPSAGKEPIFRTADSGNNSAACLWNGTDTQLNMSTWPSGGARTYIIAMRNTGPDNNAGPHDASVMVGGSDGSIRWVVTSAAYDPPNGHLTVHLNDTSAINQANNINSPEAWNIGIMRRNGSAIELWQNGQNRATTVKSLGFSPIRMGTCTTPAFEWMKGYSGVILEYSGYLPDAMISAKILEIAEALGIPNVVAL